MKTRWFVLGAPLALALLLVLAPLATTPGRAQMGPMDIPDPVAMMDQMMGQGQGMPGMTQPGMGSGMGSGMGMPGQGGMPVPPGMPMGQMGDMSMMNDMSMMASLWKLPPQRLEVVFMSQMIPHHQSAIDM